VVVNLLTIEAGEHSGNQALDDAASKWVKALKEQSLTEASAGERQVATTCGDLNIALG
jgi:hypothetical protein